MEQADIADLKSAGEIYVGSNPITGTIHILNGKSSIAISFNYPST